jgi:Co/Zn/Cd efflux system component
MISYASWLTQGEVYNITQSVTINNVFFLIFFWIRFEQFSASLFSDVFSLLTLFVSLQASEILATTR